MRFRDYREVAPGVWIPFREDRALTHPSATSQNGRKHIHLWLAVQDVKTDVDLTETVQKPQPKASEQVQDRRNGVPIDYTFRPESTQAEDFALVDLAGKTHAALGSDTEVNFIDTLLKEARAPLEKKHGIIIQLDEATITGAGGTTDVPITMNLT